MGVYETWWLWGHTRKGIPTHPPNQKERQTTSSRTTPASSTGTGAPSSSTRARSSSPSPFPPLPPAFLDARRKYPPRLSSLWGHVYVDVGA